MVVSKHRKLKLTANNYRMGYDGVVEVALLVVRDAVRLGVAPLVGRP